MFADDGRGLGPSVSNPVVKRLAAAEANTNVSAVSFVTYGPGARLKARGCAATAALCWILLFLGLSAISTEEERGVVSGEKRIQVVK